MKPAGGADTGYRLYRSQELIHSIKRSVEFVGLNEPANILSCFPLYHTVHAVCTLPRNSEYLSRLNEDTRKSQDLHAGFTIQSYGCIIQKILQEKKEW